MNQQNRKILVTSALPYANGPIHMGHLVEYIQTDIWVRFQKMAGNRCIYICADDTHGTPVMISAKKAGITPEQLIDRALKQHREDFAKFNIGFDNYYTTHSQENRELCEFIYGKMLEGGHIAEHSIEQFYCREDQMFLPDRFIRGTCPQCGAEDQYGDSCEVCSATYDPQELKNPACSVCRKTPALKKTSHYFFRLADFAKQLQQWTMEDTLQPEVRNKLQEWFEKGLKEWDISRDAPYFGFLIPGTKDKYFYVWLDAPVGYMASTLDWCKRNGEDFNSWWKSPETEIYHFIGKDIMYFHCLFWPAMLMSSGFSTPKKVCIHGFLTINGVKMSKSRGTFVKASTFANHIHTEYLRYYYACKLSGGIGDLDLNLCDFQARINSDIVGKLANLGVRASAILSKHLESRTGDVDEEGQALIDEIKSASETVEKGYENLDFAKTMREISRLADTANKFVEDKAPWITIKTDREATRRTLTAILEAFRILTLYIKPVMPELAEKVEKHLKLEPLAWQSLAQSIENKEIEKLPHLASRIEKEQLEKMMEEAKKEIEETAAGNEPEPEPIPQCTIDDLAKIDLRVAEIMEARYVEGADSLLQLTVSLGKEKRNIFAGIKSAYTPEQLVGSQVVVVANLKPRKMRFGVSEGMVLAAGEGGKNIFVIRPDEGASAGEQIH